MLSKKHQEMLKEAAVAGNIDFAVAIIKAEVPEAFHTEASLSQRVFFNEPANGAKMANCVHKYERRKAV